MCQLVSANPNPPQRHPKPPPSATAAVQAARTAPAVGAPSVVAVQKCARFYALLPGGFGAERPGAEPALPTSVEVQGDTCSAHIGCCLCHLLFSSTYNVALFHPCPLDNFFLPFHMLFLEPSKSKAILEPSKPNLLKTTGWRVCFLPLLNDFFFTVGQRLSQHCDLDGGHPPFSSPFNCLRGSISSIPPPAHPCTPRPPCPSQVHGADRSHFLGVWCSVL